MEEVTAIAASGLANAAMIAALVKSLNRQKVLSDAEVLEIYEDALRMIEQAQGASPASQSIFENARELIEQHLRPEEPTQG